MLAVIKKPNKGIHSDPKSLAAFGTGDAWRWLPYENEKCMKY